MNTPTPNASCCFGALGIRHRCLRVAKVLASQVEGESFTSVQSLILIGPLGSKGIQNSQNPSLRVFSKSESLCWPWLRVQHTTGSSVRCSGTCLDITAPLSVLQSESERCSILPSQSLFSYLPELYTGCRNKSSDHSPQICHHQAINPPKMQRGQPATGE